VTGPAYDGEQCNSEIPNTLQVRSIRVRKGPEEVDDDLMAWRPETQLDGLTLDLRLPGHHDVCRVHGRASRGSNPVVHPTRLGTVPMIWLTKNFRLPDARLARLVRPTHSSSRGMLVQPCWTMWALLLEGVCSGGAPGISVHPCLSSGKLRALDDVWTKHRYILFGYSVRSRYLFICPVQKTAWYTVLLT